VVKCELGFDGGVVTGVSLESDADLAAAAGSGDEQASDELFRRHHEAVLRYARGLVRDQHTAEDLTSEAFTRTIAALRQGMGPREAYRPYLYTVVRNAAVDWARDGRRTVVTDQVADWADGHDQELPDVDELDTLVRAFRSLPERWQTVLWHTIVEDEPVEKVAELLGMATNAVTQLAFRAREGLRQAFLAASFEDRPECAEFTAQLAAHVRRPGRRRGRALRRHLETCERCRRTAEEMNDLNGRLRRVLPIGIAVLGAPSVSLSALPVTATLPGWAIPAIVGGVGAAIVATLFATVGGGPGHPAQAGPPPSAVPLPVAPASPTATSPNEDARNGKGKPGPKKGRSPKKAGGAASGGGSQVRNTTLQSCLAAEGTSVRQRACGGKTTSWRRTDKGGGFTLKNAATGKCLARGAPSAGVPWESSTEYAVVLAPCGGAHQIWKLDGSAPTGARLSNGDGWYLQASWSGLQPVTLKKASYAGMAAQGWSIERG
jgi:RNA polymerase sigma factor (sigma-70 family)